MAYREVTVIEIKEVLRLWLRGAMGLRPIAEAVGADRKTVRRYIEAAVGVGKTHCETASTGPSRVETKTGIGGWGMTQRHIGSLARSDALAAGYVCLGRRRRSGSPLGLIRSLSALA